MADGLRAPDASEPRDWRPMRPYAGRRRFEIVDPIVEKALSTQLQAQLLEDLRDTLLPRLISGQLRLPEAEEAGEDALA